MEESINTGIEGKFFRIVKDISPTGLVSPAKLFLAQSKTTRNAASAKDATGWKTRIRSMPNSAIATKRKSRKEKSMQSPCKNRGKTIGRGLGFITGSVAV